MSQRAWKLANDAGSSDVSFQHLFDELFKDTNGYRELARILNGASGIHLVENEKSRTLMASRLSAVLKAKGLRTYPEYLRHLGSGGTLALNEFVSALTTNTTQFFREGQHFEILKNELPAILARKRKEGTRELRIWCAAASTGQEPYTIAMTVLDLIPDPFVWNIRFLASDIDREVLTKALEGTYSAPEAASIPPLFKTKYFIAMGDRDSFTVREDLRKLIRFAPFNLLTDPYPFKQPFDIVFCRNVLIYFEPHIALSVVERLVKATAPGGLLFLGHSESGAMKSRSMSPIAPAAYKKPSGRPE